jgi:hypothetical protein
MGERDYAARNFTSRTNLLVNGNLCIGLVVDSERPRTSLRSENNENDRGLKGNVDSDKRVCVLVWKTQVALSNLDLERRRPGNHARTI